MEIIVSKTTGVGVLPRSFFEEDSVEFDRSLLVLLEPKVRVLFDLSLIGNMVKFHLVISGARRKPIHKDFQISIKSKKNKGKELCLSL